ncbi:MAG: hypothetical protein MUC63_06840 [Planctomycetes bacterium]|nr:hypothetical protein [Planctomycetota bacterium]
MADEPSRPWETAAPRPLLKEAVVRDLGPLGDFVRGDLAIRRSTPLERLLSPLGAIFVWLARHDAAGEPEPPGPAADLFDPRFASDPRKRYGASGGGGCLFVLVFVGLPCLWAVYLCLLFPWLTVPAVAAPALLVAHHFASKALKERRSLEWRRESLEAWCEAEAAAGRRAAAALAEGRAEGEAARFLRERAKEVVRVDFRGAAFDPGIESRPFAGTAVLVWDGGTELREICRVCLPEERNGDERRGRAEADRFGLGAIVEELGAAAGKPVKAAVLDLCWALPACDPPDAARGEAVAVRARYRERGFPELPPCAPRRSGDDVFAFLDAGSWRRGTVVEYDGRAVAVSWGASGVQWFDATQLRTVTPPVPAGRRILRALAWAAGAASLLAAMAFTFTRPAPRRPDVDLSSIPPAAPPRVVEKLPEPGAAVWVRSRPGDAVCLPATVDSVRPPDQVVVRLLESGAERDLWLGDRTLYEDTAGRGTAALHATASGWTPVVIVEREGAECRIAWPDGSSRKLPVTELGLSFRALLEASPPLPLVALGEASAPGTAVLSRYRGTRFAFLGTVAEARDAEGKPVLAVKYADGETEARAVSDLYRDTLRPGARVEALFLEGGKAEWRPGRAASRGRARVEVLLEDGSDAWLELARVRVPLGSAGAARPGRGD